MASLKERAKANGGQAATLAELLGDLPIARVARVAGVSRDTLRVQLRGGGPRGPYRSTVDAVAGAVSRLRKAANGRADEETSG